MKEAVLSCLLHAFKERGHSVRVNRRIIEPAGGEAGFGDLEICTPSRNHNIGLITDDPDLLRSIAKEALALAAQVETLNAQRAAFKRIEDDTVPLDEHPDLDDVRNMPATSVGRHPLTPETSWPRN